LPVEPASILAQHDDSVSPYNGIVVRAGSWNDADPEETDPTEVATPMTSREDASVQTISIVVPVYKGELTLKALLAEIEPLTAPQSSPGGAQCRVSEVILVHDGAIDGSDAVMSSLAATLPFVSVIWLSRNFGQHPATLAGMSSTNGDWVVTLDEDGQNDPRDIIRLLDVAVKNDVQLVYAQPTNVPAHGFVRNSFSALAKWIFRTLLGHAQIGAFNSFRLVRGEIARGLAAYCGPGVYLDVALSWVVARSAHCPVSLRTERGRPSGYSYRMLAHHFWRLVLTSGTGPLRFVAFVGLASVLLGIGVSAYAIWGKLTGHAEVPGWASLLIVVSLFSGLTLFSLGVLAEYLGIAITMALGKPLYLITSRPNRGGPRRP
jgi:glycosyltransferase involved in cell wall biosynthesis